MVYFVVNFVIGPSLRGLHWLEGVGVHFCIKKAHTFGLRGGYSPLSPPPVSTPGHSDTIIGHVHILIYIMLALCYMVVSCQPSMLNCTLKICDIQK